jgi:hypothetical protein
VLHLYLPRRVVINPEIFSRTRVKFITNDFKSPIVTIAVFSLTLFGPEAKGVVFARRGPVRSWFIHC